MKVHKWMLLLTLSVVAGCQTLPPDFVQVPRTEPLSTEKSYLGGVLQYQDLSFFNPGYGLPKIEFRDQYQQGLALPFSVNSELVVVEIAPGEYSVSRIYVPEEFKVINFDIPPQLSGKITIGAGSITYLGDFLIKRRPVVIAVAFGSDYEYDFDRFRTTLELEYSVPETMKFNQLD